jgi:hypothetical protein
MNPPVMPIYASKPAERPAKRTIAQSLKINRAALPLGVPAQSNVFFHSSWSREPQVGALVLEHQDSLERIAHRSGTR